MSPLQVVVEERNAGVLHPRCFVRERHDVVFLVVVEAVVVGGGCSGLQYKMDLDAPRESDKVFEREGARVIVDRKSFLYLNGTELDFQDTLMSTGFTLQNPNVKRTCGCGQSFSV